MEDPTPEAIVDTVLTALVGCTRRRDLTGTLALFADDAALFGSDEGEYARGRADLRDFLATIYAEPKTTTAGPGTTQWLADTTTRSGRFVALAQVILDGEGAPPPVPYRLSGVLRLIGGSWRFALFNGAQPVTE